MGESSEAREELIEALRTPADLVRWGASRFNAAGLHFGHGTERAADEALALVLHALNLDHDTPRYLLRATLTAAERRAALALLEQRLATRKPAAYLTHEAWFAGLPFHVDERVLVPRSPIAELIETGFAPWMEQDRVQRVLDLCTGSGCIAVACALAFPRAAIDATDVSQGALEVARINVERHGLNGRVRVLHSDLFEALEGEVYDLIVSNPPYVPQAQLEALPPEYLHEPLVGLAAGDDGLAAIAAILRGAPRHLAPGGVLIVEAGVAADACAARWPELPLLWLEFARGGEGVFLLTRDDLPPSVSGARTGAGAQL